mmetsp:Transcript_103528/g.297469  ORF Transcript_103528/g.297469 Transcript_103528/m.297469 type:complete len:230 (-) Transcript_103528:1074-1763(-)
MAAAVEQTARMSFPPPTAGARVCIGGGAGFIGSHLAKRMMSEGWYVICVDWKDNEFMQPDEFCNEFLKLDLRQIENCLTATKDCNQVFNLAADMGGMGFIESNQSVLLFNNTMISFNMLEAARTNGAARYFYSSTACVYNEDYQLDPSNPGLKESYVWPRRPDPPAPRPRPTCAQRTTADRSPPNVRPLDLSHSTAPPSQVRVAGQAAGYVRSGEALRRRDGAGLRQGL